MILIAFARRNLLRRCRLNLLQRERQKRKEKIEKYIDMIIFTMLREKNMAQERTFYVDINN